MDAEWVMVWITVVYVIATILICYANLKSARATREQVAESKRQFEESKRLEKMPYFDITVLEKTEDYNFFDPDITLSLSKNQSKGSKIFPILLQFTNIGSGTAADLTFRQGDTTTSLVEQLPFTSLGSDKSQVLCCHFNYSVESNFSTLSSEVPLFLRYRDLLGNYYQQKIMFSFSVMSEEIGLKGIITSVPELETIQNKD